MRSKSTSDQPSPIRTIHPNHHAAIVRNNKARSKFGGVLNTRSRLYRIWNCMKDRCYDTESHAYQNYGGRGIGICTDWLTDYANFREWAMATGYASHLTIDRKENDLGYSPDNCRWVTMKVQQHNKRTNVQVTAWGETKNVTQWAEDSRCKVNMCCLHLRLKNGTAPEEAISAPSRIKRSVNRNGFTAWGETKTLKDWAGDPRCIVSYTTLAWRVRQEWEPHKCLTLVASCHNNKRSNNSSMPDANAAKT